MKSIKAVVRRMIDATIVPIARHISSRITPSYPAITTVLSELERRTASECADYVQANMQTSLNFSRKEDLWDHALTKVNARGLIVEFGVFSGYSINHIAKTFKDDVVYGFDSFEGLQEDWIGSEARKGTFDMGGRLPTVVANVQLVKGWFDKTIPLFLSEHGSPFCFMHIDCDTYEAAKIVFDLIGQRIQVGTVIVFDEYFGYRGWKIGEHKAWREFVSSMNFRYEYLGFSAQQVSVRITGK